MRATHFVPWIWTFGFMQTAAVGGSSAGSPTPPEFTDVAQTPRTPPITTDQIMSPLPSHASQSVSTASTPDSDGSPLTAILSVGEPSSVSSSLSLDESSTSRTKHTRSKTKPTSSLSTDSETASVDTQETSSSESLQDITSIAMFSDSLTSPPTPPTPAPLQSASPNPGIRESNPSAKNRLGAILGGVLGGISAVIICGLALCRCRRQQRTGRQATYRDGDSETESVNPPMWIPEHFVTSSRQIPVADGSGSAFQEEFFRLYTAVGNEEPDDWDDEKKRAHGSGLGSR
ncbi:hypothetical protein HGRIS_010206 [Hohenbuehelia grisea]|uniref:Mid2 domain-containing protein n=1 Tax=Hohenbuehelia grisea TaxID=104357 RepID=A0ABR3J3S1_9AGAR